jgi:hypothetical protein
LAKPFLSATAPRLHTGCTVLRVAADKHAATVDVLRHATQQVERWTAQQCIVALPVFIAARVVQSPPSFVSEVARGLRYAPWVVANIHLTAPLQDRPGAAPAWDNVIHGAGEMGGLGYVNARHQTLDPRPGPTVLTHYRALGDSPQARQALLQQPWTHWRDLTLAELRRAHPDIDQAATRVEITRYGHAMACPVPGTQKLLSKNATSRSNLEQSLLQKSKQTMSYSLKKSSTAIANSLPHTAKLRFAHGDWSGYSIFEEAFTRGHWAGSV